MRNSRQITRRELRSYFGSPVAYLFMAAFLGVTMFVFFWVETFFSRNVANIRPLFEWMPLLLIFLVAAITMRGWSEERRSGTLELLLTAPRSNLELVTGKFLGCFGLVAVAIALTLPIPITISFIGPLDWGPVAGGYIASLLLAGAYIALGLFVSLLTESQIISLIGTLLIGLILYFIGSPALTNLTSEPVTGILHGLSTSARFDSISRGVVDLRDLVYYLSLIVLFLGLNMLVLMRMRRAGQRGSRRHRGWQLAALLLGANVVLVNVWLAPVNGMRADLTAGHIYSLSGTSTAYLHQLRQPLLIRGYFSKKTHPLLAPLVPHLKNLLREYHIRGGDNVHVQIVDPQDNPKAAKVAARRYDIQPVPFRIQNKYQSSVVNSYFNVLIQYGNQHKVLGLNDLIETRPGGTNGVNVVLNDPEYQITSAIKQLVSKYRRGGNIFQAIDKPVTLTAYISGKSRLPKQLVKLRAGFKKIVGKLQKKAGDKLVVDIRDPGDPAGDTARQLASSKGIQPFSTGLLNGKLFYFNLVLSRGDQRVPVSLPDNLDSQGLKKNIKSALDRFATGLLNTIAVYTPSQPSPYQRRRPTNGAQSYKTLIQALQDHAVVQRTTLDSGHLPAGTNLLLVLAPSQLSKKQLFTIDQFMMRGGTTIIAASPFDISVGGPQGLSAHAQKTGLKDWLAAKGIHIKPKLVLDPQNASFPIPVVRDIGGVPMREYRQTDYPYFVDVRQNGMPEQSFITDGLGQLTMTWASPISVKKKLPGDLQVHTLLRSTDQAWLSAGHDIKPAAQANATAGHAGHGQRASRTLGVVVSGRFQSWFKSHDNPFLAAANKPDKAADNSKGKAANAAHGDKAAGNSDFKASTVIGQSPDDTRLVLVSSPTFLSDIIMQLESASAGRNYTQPVTLMRNTLHWALDDPALLALRDQHRVSRILKPLNDTQREFWEYLNYGLAVLGLLIVFLIARGRRLRREAHYRAELGMQDTDGGQA